ncbi:MAG: amidohydrolase family protein, partial [Rhodospirillaceae bacterium]|nr:amidohydrolase family protein [Rhodospirillaceae bacterium]
MKSIQLACAAALLGAVSHAVPAQDAPDHILVNGKIATVDDLFSIREAVALRGERIVAVGSNAAIEALADAGTRRTDLGGRTVIPGLIDNHNHVVRATEYWPNEARLDGVTSRGDALQLLQAKARTLPEGQWLMSLGGWSEAQFAGDRSDFTLTELDAVAPDRPAFIQSVYDHAFGNTAWFEAMGIALVASEAEHTAATGLAAHAV